MEYSPYLHLGIKSKLMNRINLPVAVISFFVAIVFFSSYNRAEADPPKTPTPDEISAPKERSKAKGKVQVAMLLDTSNSMDGLIEQAKNRLWDIVNTMSTLYYKEEEIELEIALYQYGNDHLSPEKYYVQKVLSFTSNLDDISEKLFALTTNGGEEYCGAVMKNALNNLEWSNRSQDIRLIYIAGNEAFTQGPISYGGVIKEFAVPKDVKINTIFCGGFQQGVSGEWANGAKLGNGKYFAINSDASVRHIATPYDDDIIRCNLKLKNTYIGYGNNKEAKMSKMNAQDENAKSLSEANYTKRIVSKSKKAMYNNESWDLVDKYEKKLDEIDDIDEENLPEEMQSMSGEEKVAFVKKKSKEREEVVKEIADLNRKRQAYIREKTKEEDSGDDLGMAIQNSIIELATSKNYTIVED